MYCTCGRLAAPLCPHKPEAQHGEGIFDAQLKLGPIIVHTAHTVLHPPDPQIQ